MAAYRHNKGSPLRMHWFLLTVLRLIMCGVKTCWPGFTERWDNTRLLPAQRDKSPALSGSSGGVWWMAVIQWLKKNKNLLGNHSGVCCRGNASNPKPAGFTMRLSSLREVSSGVTVRCPALLSEPVSIGTPGILCRLRAVVANHLLMALWDWTEICLQMSRKRIHNPERYSHN